MKSTSEPAPEAGAPPQTEPQPERSVSQRQRNQNLHGSVPDQSATALLLLDVINALDFPEGEQIQPAALAMGRQLHELRQFCRENGLPVVYVNDNFGRWQSNFSNLYEHAVEENSLGRELAELLKPTEDDYFVLKPKHSGFFSTTLDTLLQYLGCTRLIVTGLAGNICVLFTAQDAYMRDFDVVVPADCIACNTSAQHEWALDHLRSVCKADTRPWRESVRDCQELVDSQSDD